jgi:transposase-like protein
MCVHGIAISAIARIKTIAWGTVSRWVELAALFAERFNRQKIKGFVIHELQADEIRTYVGNKEHVVWILTALEVWSRLWITVGVGRRNYRNVKAGIRNVLQRGIIKYRFLFTTDGFEIYEWAVRKLLASVCIYGQVIKKRRENRVIRVDRKLLLGTQAELEESLFHSEDSKTLNTSFVERHNLTIRQGCSYLGRRKPSHARQSKSLRGQMDLLMLYYNFMRPHLALKFGRLVKTPAMQAGIAAERISFRDVFTSFFLFFMFARYCRFNLDRSWQALWMKFSIQQHLPDKAPVFCAWTTSVLASGSSFF